jgi:hypothetical protein
MESFSGKPLQEACHCSWRLLGLMCLLGTADARPMLPRSDFKVRASRLRKVSGIFSL